jgi:hypothetical protein
LIANRIKKNQEKIHEAAHIVNPKIELNETKLDETKLDETKPNANHKTNDNKKENFENELAKKHRLTS